MLARDRRVQVPDIGKLDTNDVTPIRLDRYLRDGDGSVYWWMTTLLPGFRQFRFPAKLFTLYGVGPRRPGRHGLGSLPARQGARDARPGRVCWRSRSACSHWPCLGASRSSRHSGRNGWPPRSARSMPGPATARAGPQPGPWRR